jgi:hypothetical protein
MKCLKITTLLGRLEQGQEPLKYSIFLMLGSQIRKETLMVSTVLHFYSLFLFDIWQHF